jgi:Tfp pilus assembly protein PilX
MHRRPPSHRPQRGFSVVLVLMLLVLLGGVLAYGATLTSSLHSGLAQEIAIGRSEQAARSGVQWGRWRMKNLPANSPCFATTTLSLPLGAPQSVTVSCAPANGASASFVEGPTTVYRYRISAVACSPAGPAGCPNPNAGSDYVERRSSAWAER